MRSTFKVLFYLKRDKQKANGMIPLYCRITVDGQEVRFGMKCDVNPKYWDVEAGRATGRTTEAVNANALVDNTKSAIYKIYRELQERDNYVTAEKIKNIFLGIDAKQQTLLELFDSHNKEKKELIGINYAKNTYQRYCIARKLIANFILYKYNLHDVSLKEVNGQFIDDFDVYLLSQCNFSKNGIITIQKKLRHIIEVALNKEYITRNPFKEHKLQWQKVDRGYLTQSELETLIDYRFEEKRLEKARDIFIFCSFTGMSYTDVKHLTHNQIKSSVEGNLWIRGKRLKTDTEYNIPLLNIPKMILEKYKGKVNNDLALPVVVCAYYNRLLKKIGQMCGIKKNLSSHLARHTFATLTLTKGVSIESVSKMLGHTNINTTQIYAKVTNTKISHEMSAFAGNVKKMDMRLLSATGQKNLTLEDVLKSLKISTANASENIWEKLTVKVWNKLSNIDKQHFTEEIKNMENVSKTIQDFYVLLIDYFLDNLTNQNESVIFSDNEYLNKNVKSAV